MDTAEAAARLRLPNPTLCEVGNTFTGAFTILERFKVMDIPQFKEKLLRNGTQLLYSQFEHGILSRPRTLKHMFWGINSANNIFIRLCKYMDLCTPEEVQSAVILSPTMSSIGGWRQGLKYPSSSVTQVVFEVFQCFGPVVVMNHPKTTIIKETNHLVVVKSVLAGIGEEVSEPHSAKDENNNVHYKRIGGSVALARQRNLRQCAELPADPPPVKGASVLLVNRPHGVGRHIIGLDDVYDQLTRELTPHGIPVRLVVPRVESLASQAAIFANANVVIVPHGAANANFAFLPHRAVVFGVHAIRHRFILDYDHTESLPSPPYNVTLIPIRCNESIQVDSAKISSIPEFNALLTPEERSYILTNPKLGPEKVKLLKRIGLTDKDFMRYADYAPNTTSLALQVAGAALELHEYLQELTHLNDSIKTA